MPAKKPKEAPAVVEDVALADGAKARLPAARATAEASAPSDDKASALRDDSTSWRGTCAICLELLPVESDLRMFYECCAKKMCKTCSLSCLAHDKRCPLCRAPLNSSNAEWRQRLQKHVDHGHAEAQVHLGEVYHHGLMGLKKSVKRALQLYRLSAAQGHAHAMHILGYCYRMGDGVKIDFKAAAAWYRGAADQGHQIGQYSLGGMFYEGKGVAQCLEEAVRLYRLSASQGHADALFALGTCLANGSGAERDFEEALRCLRRAGEKGNANAADAIQNVEAWLEATKEEGR